MNPTLSKRDVDAARAAMARELEEWSMYPLLESMPQYLAPIAKDAGVDLRALKSMNSTLRGMDRNGHGGGAAADALAGRMAVQIRRLIEQVDSASLGQIASYGGLDGTLGAQRSGNAPSREHHHQVMGRIQRSYPGRAWHGRTKKMKYAGREITLGRTSEAGKAGMWQAAIRTLAPNGESCVIVYAHGRSEPEVVGNAKAAVDEIDEKLSSVARPISFHGAEPSNPMLLRAVMEASSSPEYLAAVKRAQTPAARAKWLADQRASMRPRSGDARRADSPGGALYRVFVKEMVARCGMGFHPDTPVDSYTDDKGKPGFSKAETKRLQAMESKAYAMSRPYGMGDFDQYEIAMQEMRPLIEAAKKRTER